MNFIIPFLIGFLGTLIIILLVSYLWGRHQRDPLAMMKDGMTHHHHWWHKWAWACDKEPCLEQGIVHTHWTRKRAFFGAMHHVISAHPTEGSGGKIGCARSVKAHLHD